MGFTRFIQSLDDLVDRKISNIHTSLPAKIVGYSNGRVDVQPYGKYFVGDVSLDYPVLLGCPVTSSGVASPINVGDDCLVLVTEQSLENWLNNTSGNEVNEKWSLSNCIAVCGLQKLESAEQAQANSSGHSVVGNLDSTGSVTIQGMDVKDSIEECEDRVDVVEDAVEACEEQVGECTAKVGELEDDVEELNATKANKSDIVDNLTTDDATKMLSAKQGKVLSESKATTEALTSHTGNTNNPHSVTKAQVGLENVGNFKAVSTEASQGLTDAEKENAKANIGAYAVPSSGIPDTDLSASVQASLALANTSLQSSALVTEVSGSSTDAQIPSAKAVYDDVFAPLKEDKADKMPRYKDITSYFTDGTLWNRISGTGYSHPYYDICVGDYLDMGATVTCPDSYSGTVGSRYVTVASLGGLRCNGDDNVVDFPHLVMIPGQGAGGSFHFGRHAMNDTHTTVGGYVGSKMHTDVLGAVVSSGYATGTINQQLYNIFGTHLKTTRELLTNSINASGHNRFGANSGCSNSWEWTSCQACLMSEVEVYGSAIWSSSGYDTGAAKRQFELFAMDEKAINNRSSYYWLKDVVSASLFALVNYRGYAVFYSAGYAINYVRPRFVIA